MKTYKRFGLLLLGTLAVNVAAAGEWDASGFLGVDAQAFWLDSQHASQSDDPNLSLLFQPEFYWRSEDDSKRISVVGFARADSHDSKRTHADLREAYFGLDGDDWDVNLGVNKVFWGVAESRHLVDVINQTDLVEDIDQEDKLGQPMLNLNLQRDFGRFGLFVMPFFRERTFPGPEGRFRTSLPVDTDNPIYESAAEEQHVDLALRYSHYIGDVDIGLHVFDGTSREPRFVLAPEGDRLLPVYEQMTQAGVDLQYTRESWLWKLETIGRNSSSDSFAAAVGGFEYTLFGARGSSTDVGFLLEYLYDGRNAEAPPTVFDNDVFVATRIALNDANDSSLLAGIAADIDTREMFLNVEAERRFGDNLNVELRLRAFMNVSPGNPLHAFERDDYLQLRFSWYY